MKLSKIAKKIEKVQSDKRFEHTFGVLYTAAALAMRYKENVENARLAGLLHDCGKHLSDERMLELCDKYSIKVSKVERENPFLLHGKVGAVIAQKKFKIDDKDILNAVTFHTTGRPGMSLLEKIIYISDFIEPNRNQTSCLEEVRKMAFEDIDKCLLMILENTLAYISDKEYALDPLTKETYDYYTEKIKNGK